MEINDDPLNWIQLVEVSLTELCNRKCFFCPRIDPAVYPNRNLHMSTETMTNLAVKLEEINYQNRISIAGFGEPMLHSNYLEMCSILRKKLPDNKHFELITNGDRIKSITDIQSFFDAGVNHLYISLYDNEDQADFFKSLLDNYELKDHITLRKLWGSDPELNLTNRAGTVNIGNGLTKPMNRPCHYPFYALTVDWDGAVLLCDQDWNKKVKLGNVNYHTLEEIWLSPQVNTIRNKLLNGSRNHSPCRNCNVDGTAYGGESFRKFGKYLHGS